jgi:hypothetical protein
MMIRSLLLAGLAVWLASGLHAQAAPPPTDTIVAVLPGLRPIEPAKSLRWSLIPGGGQIYNRRYWKAPIVYGAFVGVAAWVDFNTTNYNRLQEAYQLSLLGSMHEFSGTRLDSPTSLRRLRDSYNKRRQTAYAGLLILYAMQSMEAFVDAHLSTFDIREDLELGFRPSVVPLPGNELAAGMGVFLRF